MSGGGGKAPSSTTTTNQLYSPEEAARRAKVMAEAERIYGGINPANLTAPGMSPDTQASQNMMRNLAAQNPMAGIGEMLQGSMEAGLNANQDPTNTPGFQSTLNTATRKVDEAYMGPRGPFAGIRQASQTQNSGGSGTREGIAMGMAGRDYLNTIGDVTGKLTSDAYKFGTDTSLKTMAMAPQTMQGIMSAEGTPAAITGAIGQQNEAYENQARQWELSAPWAALGPYANIVGGMSEGGTTTTSTGSAPQANPMAPLGYAAMGASIGASAGPYGAAAGAAAGLIMSMFMK